MCKTQSGAEDMELTVNVLLHEYRAMYDLAILRMNALDRRVPVAAATLAAFLGSISVIPQPAAIVFLVGLPATAVWILRITINHARSFEDALRRIEQIEHLINTRMHAVLLSFQSNHPSRHRSVGGRTGMHTVETVSVGAVILLAGCLYLAMELVSPNAAILIVYSIYILLLAAGVAVDLSRFGRYRYTPEDPTNR